MFNRKHSISKVQIGYWLYEWVFLRGWFHDGVYQEYKDFRKWEQKVLMFLRMWCFSVFDFKSEENGRTFYFRFKNESDIKEVVEIQESYVRQFSSQNTAMPSIAVKDSAEISNKYQKGKYRLKSSRPPSFSHFSIYRTSRVCSFVWFYNSTCIL